MERVTAESRAADPAIQAVQDVVPAALDDELGDGSRPHAAPPSVPAVGPAVDGDFARGGLVVRVRIGWAVAAPEVFEKHGDRIEARGAGDHQLRHRRALNLQRLSDIVFCGHGTS
ncbi:hypothetical protein D3C86_1397020 [compost metagenome]